MGLHESILPPNPYKLDDTFITKAWVQVAEGTKGGETSGIPAAFYFLLADPREAMPMMAPTIHMKAPFNRMLLRHDLWKKKFPDSPEVHGVPWTGIANASQELKDLAKPRIGSGQLPFDPLEYVEHLDELPFDQALDPSLGD